MEKIRFKPPRKEAERKHWYHKEPTGTKEELQEAFEVSESYLYKLLSYADSPNPIPQDELDRERRIFTFCKQGPRAGHFALSKNGKLVSADVLYMLTSSLPSEIIGKQFGVDGRKVREIRTGQNEEWFWEYALVRRLKAIIKNQLIRHDASCKFRRIYSLSKQITPERKEILYYVTAKRKAVALRRDILAKKEFDKMTKDKTIDILYPIDLIEVLA